jgi:hypothetical protein
MVVASLEPPGKRKMALAIFGAAMGGRLYQVREVGDLRKVTDDEAGQVYRRADHAVLREHDACAPRRWESADATVLSKGSLGRNV